MNDIRFAWICRNIHFNEIERVELTDDQLINDKRPSWITSDNCEIIAKIRPTGLKDKNGKEIYEGDIVRWLDGNGEYRIDDIKWDREGGAWIISDAWFLNEISEPEIIGHIHENKSLLDSN